MVFYRKYRPQTISDLDLALVRDKLFAILKSEDVAHAFLFAGPKGLGKTSSARILAKAINCEKNSKGKGQKSKVQVKIQKLEISKDQRPKTNDQIEPCNNCDVCLSITNGSNIDVIEIDAASNRGIDEIRDLREKIKFTPVSLSKKVYIIDEVHMLTPEAFNALLKTLEEPPSHAIFILCTTEFWKLPETIISRTFFIKFEKPGKEELKRSINRILKGEGIKLADEVYEHIYSLSEGSFRDTAKIIEELALLSKDKEITMELFESSFKTKSIESEINNLLISLSQKDAKESLLVIARLADNGVDFKVVVERIVDYLRRLLLKKLGLESGFDGIKDVENLNLADVRTLIEYFSQAYKDLKFAVLPQLPLELAVVKWGLEGKHESRIMNQVREKNVEVKKPVAVEKMVEEKKTEKVKDPSILVETSKTADNQLDLARAGDQNYLNQNF